MLDALRFVLRGVAKSSLSPDTLTHLAIRNGRVTAFNGVLSLSAPLALSFDAAPLATPFYRALNACEGVISLAQESKSKLTVRSGSFSAIIPCVDVKTVPIIEPEGITFLPVDIVAGFRALRPFVCSDPSRPALNGILLTGESAYTTNNVTVVQCWLGTPFPFELNVPVFFIDELLRVKEEPKTLQMTTSSLTAHYVDGRWIRTQLNALEWPHVAGVLNKAWAGNVSLPAISKEFKAACGKLATFGAKVTTFKGLSVTTGDGMASVEVEVPDRGSYYTQFLQDVLDVATDANWTRNPALFANNVIRGVLCGVRE